jgi:hypothetical protein
MSNNSGGTGIPTTKSQLFCAYFHTNKNRKTTSQFQDEHLVLLGQ